MKNLSPIFLRLFHLVFIQILIAQECKDTFRFSVYENPPFVAKELVEYGVDSHLVSAALQSEGYCAKFEFYPAFRALKLAELGKSDGSFSWKKRLNKEAFYLSNPLRSSDKEYLFFLLEHPIPWRSEKVDFELLQGLRVGGLLGFEYDERFLEAEKKQLFQVEGVSSLEQNFQKLILGKLDVVLSQKRSAEYVWQKYFKTQAIQSFAYIELDANKEEFEHLLISKKSPRGVLLNEAFNRGLQKIKMNGVYRLIFDELQKGSYLPDKQERVDSLLLIDSIE